MSEYLFLYRAPTGGPKLSPDEMQKRMQAMMKWMKELGDNGHIKNAGQPLEATGKVVSNSGKSITDGPYAEAKDVVLGYMIIEARDLAQAADLAKAAPMIQGDGVLEVRPVRTM
jgi:hypothetical protein